MKPSKKHTREKNLNNFFPVITDNQLYVAGSKLKIFITVQKGNVIITRQAR
jgi:hypothetical protein